MGKLLAFPTTEERMVEALVEAIRGTSDTSELPYIQEVIERAMQNTCPDCGEELVAEPDADWGPPELCS